ncbi:MFS transporter [Amycolatopsis jejuensis]|uniref:MFS transporter n=1 Tax=Amycolatopsis jejuensis TaxID=330084 RepID=UPI0007C4E073|nr:MFS transporter [Amycolatopsis jejuensis]
MARQVPNGRQRMSKRVAISSFVGNCIELYDFVIYGTAAGLVFGHAYFPALGAAGGTIAALATQAVAFLLRPAGAILFGHFGDRLGRKKTLVITLLMMGGATTLVGVLPTSSQIGVAAPIALLLLRMLQGLAAGGEWAGATLFSSENAPAHSRGFWSSIATAGAGVSVVLGTLVFSICSSTMSDDAFNSIGWRIPFLVAAPLIVLGLYIRLKLAETPVFKNEAVERGVAKAPFVEALKSQPRQILFGSGIPVILFAFYYIAATYLPNYGTTHLGLHRTSVFVVIVIGGTAYTIGVLLGGALSDRFGRRPTLVFALAFGVVWSLLLFPLLKQASIAAFGIGVTVTMIISALGNGPLGGLYTEQFRTRYRYTATAVCYNGAGILGGGVAPLLGAVLVASYGTFAFGLLLAIFSVLSLVCAIGMGETRGRRLENVAAPARSTTPENLH